MKRTPLALVALLAAGCSSWSPVPIAVGDVCTRCHRTIRDTRIAGEIIDSGGRAWKFQSPSCMAAYVAQKSPDTAAIYVTDYQNGRMIKASAAVFVETTIGEGLQKEQVHVAYSSTGAAREAAAAQKTTPMEWEQLVQASRTAS
jgi:hypothetical protein